MYHGHRDVKHMQQPYSHRIDTTKLSLDFCNRVSKSYKRRPAEPTDVTVTHGHTVRLIFP